MLDILIQLDFLGKFIKIAINLHPYIATFLCLFQKFCVGTLTTADNRCQQLQFRPLRQCHNMVYHLIDSLLLDLFAAFRAVRNTDTCIQQSEIIINFCNSSHGRTWVSVGRFLVNRDCRRKSLDRFHIRFFHLSQELSRI